MTPGDSDVGAVAARVAAALTALDEQTWRVIEDAGRVQLCSTSGDLLGLHMRGYGPQTGRLIVRCCEPADARDVPDLPDLAALRAQVTVDPGRPAARIAADLRRRLITAYRHARPAARAWRRGADALAAAETAIVAETGQHLAVLPGTLTTSTSSRPALMLSTEHPHRGALESFRISQVHLALAPYLAGQPRNGDRPPLYADVQLRVHPRLLPALARAVAEVAATTDLTAVPPHQCPHAHQPVCPHGHDHPATP